MITNIVVNRRTERFMTKNAYHKLVEMWFELQPCEEKFGYSNVWQYIVVFNLCPGKLFDHFESLEYPPLTGKMPAPIKILNFLFGHKTHIYSHLSIYLIV
jgi:hypothetical protein